MQLFLSFNSAERTSLVAVQKLLRARGITTFLERPAWFRLGWAPPLAAARAAAGEHMGRCQLYTPPRPGFCCEIRTFQAYKGVNGPLSLRRAQPWQISTSFCLITVVTSLPSSGSRRN